MKSWLLILLTVLCVSLPGQNAEDVRIEKDYQAALLENKDFAVKMAEYDSLRQAGKKAAYQYAADKDGLKKTLDEYYRVSELLRTEKDPNAQRALFQQAAPLRTAMRRELLHSDEFIRFELESRILSSKMGLMEKEIVSGSTDPRFLKFQEYLNESVNRSFKEAVTRMPKADCNGSDEYRAAMHAAELYKEDPLKHKWTMVHCSSGLLQKVQALAQTDPEVKAAKNLDEISMNRLMMCMYSLNLKHLELYRQAELAQLAGKEASQKAYEQGEILRKACENDPEYVRISNERTDAAEHYRRKVDEFVAKSNAPEAVEYRKFSEYLQQEEKRD